MTTPSVARQQRAPAPAPDALVERVELLRRHASSDLEPARQAELGQFLTPSSIARLMASMFEAKGRCLRILDAGAGVGSLAAALVADLCSRRQPPMEISVVAFEIDPAMGDALRATLDLTAGHCKRAGVGFTSEIRREDFIGAGVSMLRGGLFPALVEEFDAAILNPPYRKIAADSQTRRLLAAIGCETTNLYAAFVWIAARLLKPRGEIVAITPRSFCNGPYFRSFRKALLGQLVLRRLHCFEARDRAFSDDEVLQENVIVHAVHRPAIQKNVVVSASLGPEDECPTWREVSPTRVVRPDDPECFIHLPADALSEAIASRVESLHGTLENLELEASTGRVVDFRAEAFLREEPGPGTVPLVYPGHMSDGVVHWPRTGGRKPNALALAPETKDLLVPGGYYVLVKRFSSKEEPRRIVAAVYDPNRVPAEDVAFENHLNYYHAHGSPLPERLARGLAVFLNSTLIDCYFRDWSGHTQVNASDLRRLSYPTRIQLEMLGESLPPRLDSEEIDRRIESLTMPSLKKSGNPVRAKKRLREGIRILKELGLPREQQNERSALTLLALLDLKPKTPWDKASNPRRGITEMMGYFEEHYGKTYKPNTRETVRRFTVHQFVQAGLAVPNPDEPARPTNSPKAVYQIEHAALTLLRTYGTPEWPDQLKRYLAAVPTLQKRYAHEREMQRIPLALPTGAEIALSPGGQNVLVQKIVEEFCARFTPGAKPVYVGDTAEKWAYFDRERLASLGVTIDSHGKMPDVVVHHASKGWLVLIEAVTSHGPVGPKRQQELRDLFSGCKAGLVFVTAFLARRDLVKYLGEIAWETEVWVAESPSHLIHFNGERFLGPFAD